MRLRNFGRANPDAVGPQDLGLFLRVRSQTMQRIFAKLASAMGAMPIQLRVSIVDTPMASAFLFANYQKHLLVRAGEQMSLSNVKKLLGVIDAKSPEWSWVYPQKELREAQYSLAIKDLEFQKKCLQAKLLVEDSDGQLKTELSKVEETMAKVRGVLQHMQPVMRGSMHPDPGVLAQSDSGSANGEHGLMLVGPNSPWRMRGIMVRIAGARKGQRAQSWKRYAGSYSTNSVDYVNAEEAKEQILTKYGTYGLTVRMVRELCSEMPHLNMKSPVSRDGLHYYEPFRVYSRLDPSTC